MDRAPARPPEPAPEPMETRANYALIGLFTLATIAAALGFVVWFARLSEGNKADRYQVVFTGSVSGLSVGSSVLFNGLRVGQVETLDLFPGDPSRVIGVITVKNGTPVKVDTRARLEIQGFTGGAYVQLYGGSATTALLEPQNGEAVATIYAERSELQNLVDGARDTIAQAAQTLGHVDQLLRENESSIGGTIKNVQIFTQALADNSGNVSEFLKTTGEAAKSISRLSDNLNGMSGDLQAILKAVDPQKIQKVVNNVTDASDQLAAIAKGLDAAKLNASIDNIQSFTQTLADARAPLASFANDASALAGKLNALAPKLEASLDGIEKLTAAIDGKKIGNVVDNVDKFTAALGNNAGELDAIVKNAHALSGQLADIAPKLANAVDNINRVTAAIDGDKINRVVGNVDKFTAALGDFSPKIGTVVDNVDKFSAALGNNAGELDSILKDARALAAQLKDVGPKLATAVDNFNRVATAIDGDKIDRVFGNVDKFAAALGESSPKVQGVIDDASDIGKKVNAAADKLASILKNVDDMTTSKEGKGMFAEITEAARSIRTLAQNLDERTAVLSKNLNDFAGPGLREYKQIAVDGQRTLQSIQRTLNSLQRNPQQLIFGPKSNIPDFKGN